MKLEHRLQILIAVLSMLGTFLLGTGQNNATLPLVMFVAAPLALYFTDRRGWFRLNRPVANIAALIAVSYALFDFFSNSVQNQLLAIANLLLYLQLVLLFQEKSPRLYWQLLVLSLLQVVVAAAMNLSVQFGVLLIGYMVLAFISMGCLFVLRETRRCHVDDETTATKSRQERKSESEAGVATRRAVTVGSFGSLDDAVASVAAARSHRPVAVLCLLTLAFTAALFYAAPRVRSANFQGGRSGRQARVGFSQQVSLDELGEILESDDLAMRVAFFKRDDDTPYEVKQAPYFRGAVMTRYSEPMAGRWTRVTASKPLPLPDPPPNAPNLVRQEVTLEAISDGVLFAAYPSYRLPETPKEVQFDRDSGQYSMQTSTPWGGLGRVRYDVGTTAFQNGRQSVVTPQELVAEVRDLNRHLTELEGCARFDSRRFPNVARLADEILRDAGAERAGRVRKARVLELHFQQPGRYQYSLNVRTRRRGDLDPVEDFLVNTKAGHCEYFATALALMLRSQGIPSRLVVGYHGGELNPVGNYYLVRQRDAHAWVEAYIRPEDREELNLEEGLTPGQGGWLRLDPTPGAEEGSPTASTGWLGRAEQMLDYAEFLWTDYVLGMNSERQSQTVYDPVFKRWNEQLSAWLDYNTWREWLLEKWRVGGGWKRWIQAVIDRPLIAAIATLAIIGVVGAWIRARHGDGGPLQSRRWWIWSSRKTNDARRPTIEFYRAFETTMSRRGCRRKPGQTPREWLTELTATAGSIAMVGSLAKTDVSLERPRSADAPRLADTLPSTAAPRSPDTAHSPGAPRASSGLPASLHAAAWLIVDGFYRVRYGGAELAAEESRAIELALAAIQAEN
ncbi:MAG TPA: DUF3488 and transglutaminase-like domain-containing protein [Pirellulaceae bacterium]|nr:DUF3488 and transglutaminase-like domain-containing protein [Pirellulaceae bacterium]